MNKEFLPYEESLALKELGFDELCFAYYAYGEANILRFDRFVSKNKSLLKAPLYQQVFRWFREKHNLLAWINYHSFDDLTDGSYHWYIHKISDVWEKNSEDTYEEAELACIREMIKIVKEK